MQTSGTADLPLHSGPVPPWLMPRMRALASRIVRVIVDEYGVGELLRRMGDPLWFQSLGCVLGFDWHSSGLTTVVSGALREALSLEEHGVAAAGGKGQMSRRVPEMVKALGLNEAISEKIIHASRMTAKVDNAVLQDGYTIYHHIILFTEKGEWAVIQQGMNPEVGYARRYHWVGGKVDSFVVEPHSGIAGSRREQKVLNMVSRRSEEARKASVDLASEKPEKTIRILNRLLRSQETITRWMGEGGRVETHIHLHMPRRVNWHVLRRIYEVRPRNYEELVGIKGVGPSTVRALALVAAIIHGAEPDWRDSIKFTFAVGGKDGVPRPISRRTYDEVIGFMRGVVEASGMEAEERRQALRRLFTLERMLYGP